MAFKNYNMNLIYCRVRYQRDQV